MSRTYFITGGNGNISRQLACELIKDGSKVVLFDLQSDPINETNPQTVYISGDITNFTLLRKLFEEHLPTHVLHMASMLSGSSEANRPRAWEVNATASYQLLELSLEFNVDCFFFPSTAATYGSNVPDPLPEDFPQWPENIYGATKVGVERSGAYFYHKHGLNFRGVRLPFVISQFAPDGALTAYASRVFVEAVKGNHFSFPVNAEAVASTIYVKDVVSGIVQFINVPNEQLTRRVYNMHAFAPTTESIALAIKKKIPGFSYSFDPKPNVVKMIDALPAVMVDVSARKDWGWNPEFSLEEMVNDFLSEL
ncbi:MAG: NAD-dependent epimerase/dehydratase family protein [Bacteroidetes bacterium]|nr:NAD-dependent epimerase/dehydratase family protein [Bacteroidota bacterium]MDA1121802.1 NAD-dependent epimerase/dehydratase family protein [Bacteroidota bacterium]